MTQAYIKDLVDYNGDIVYPRTKVEAIYDADGNMLNDKLNNTVSSVKVNGVEQTITDGAVDIEVPDPDLSEYAKTEDVTTALATKAPAYTYGTEDMTAGTSELATGTLYLMYEE